MRRSLILALLLLIASATGCQNTQMPRFFGWQGPARAQRAQASYWDPYPKNDMNDVSLNDLRPRDYLNPWSEVKRAQMSPYAPLSLGR